MFDFIKEHLGEIAVTTFIILYKKLFPESKDKDKDKEDKVSTQVVDIAKENNFHIKDIKDTVDDIKDEVLNIKNKM